MIGSIAAAPQTQRTASTDRQATDSQRVQGENANDLAAELAAGIGQTEGDQAAEDRDGDGRLPWQREHHEHHEALDPSTQHIVAKSRDVTGESGSSLDLDG